MRTRLRLSLSILIPVLVLGALGGWTYTSLRDRAIDQASDRLETLLALRQAALGHDLETLASEIVLYSSLRTLPAFLVGLQEAWTSMGPNASATLHELYVTNNPHPPTKRELLDDALDGSAYSTLHAERHSRIREFRNHHDYYDVFLIDNRGNLLYTTRKEEDFAANLLEDPFSNTGLAEVFREALASKPGAIAFADFAPYAPSDDEPAAFLAGPITNDTGLSVIGVLALQLSPDGLKETLHFTAGMGRTGETYLVGADLLMRSDSRFSEESTVLRTTVDTDSVRRALDGETGVQETMDYRGEIVLSAYTPLKFEEVTWALIAEIDKAEVVASLAQLRNALFAVVVLMSILLSAVITFLTRPAQE